MAAGFGSIAWESYQAYYRELWNLMTSDTDVYKKKAFSGKNDYVLNQSLIRVKYDK